MTADATLTVIPVPGIPEIADGDDLGAIVAGALAAAGVRDGDIVAVTQKVVSKAEGRVVREHDAPGGKQEWVQRESRRVLARRDDLVIAETHHGFVCANAGVDASNVADGMLALLPEDPDASADRLRSDIEAATGSRVGVVITDTFGRPWRQGVTEVAIGCAGLPPLVDLRGTPDAGGRELEATVIALADEIASAAGLVMGKAASVPAAIVRGVEVAETPVHDGTREVGARSIVRSPDEDLFRESPLLSLSARRTIRSFGAGEVPRTAVEDAVRAACTAPAPHHTRPWLFVALDEGSAKRRLLSAMATAWADDLRSDGTDTSTIARRLDRSDALLGAAPVLIVPAIRMEGAHTYPDDERAAAEREMFLLAGGAGIQTLLLALHAQGLASSWISSTLFCKQETRAVLGLDEDWIPLGTVAVGRPPEGTPPPRPELRLDEHLRWMDGGAGLG